MRNDLRIERRHGEERNRRIESEFNGLMGWHRTVVERYCVGCHDWITCKVFPFDHMMCPGCGRDWRTRREAAPLTHEEDTMRNTKQEVAGMVRVELANVAAKIAHSKQGGAIQFTATDARWLRSLLKQAYNALDPENPVDLSGSYAHHVAEVDGSR